MICGVVIKDVRSHARPCPNFLRHSLTAPHASHAQASRMLAAKGLRPPAGNGGDSDDNLNEPIFAARLLVKSLRALEAPEGEGCGAAAAGTGALLAAVERAVERRVGELPPGYTAEGEVLIKGDALCVGEGMGVGLAGYRVAVFVCKNGMTVRADCVYSVEGEELIAPIQP